MTAEQMDAALCERIVANALDTVNARSSLDFHLRLAKLLEAARALAVHRG